MTRRRLLGLAAISAMVGTAYFLGFHQSDKFLLRHSKPMMGTIVNFTVIGKNEATCNEALLETIDHMEKVGYSINWYDPTSPLSQLNKDGVLENVDPVLLHVTQKALEISRLTNGAFDPTVLPLLGLYKNLKKTGELPSKQKLNKALSSVDYRKVHIENSTIRFQEPGMGMTLDGIGKGYVVDEGVKKINALGFQHVIIEAGGDLMATGLRRSGEPWTIAIQNPRPEEGGKRNIITIQDRAIATSGDYMQAFTKDHKYHHIINPKTGFSPPELASSSILAPSVATADGLATSTMVMGPEKSISLLESLDDCEGFLIGKDLATYSTQNFFS